MLMIMCKVDAPNSIIQYFHMIIPKDKPIRKDVLRYCKNQLAYIKLIINVIFCKCQILGIKLSSD